MPNRDGIGPDGEGPRTGRQMGNCEDAKPNEDASDRPLRRRGFGRRPRRFRNRK